MNFSLETSCEVTGDAGKSGLILQPSLMVQAIQFLIAMFVFDAWQYFLHRYIHHNKFLYRTIHSRHHKLIVPWPFGAMYNHPLEGFLIVSYLFSGMTPRTSIFFFSFVIIKCVDDHCGILLPGNPFHIIFHNNTAYHDVHHQLHGVKYNFSHPFFIFCDKLLWTHDMPYTIMKRPDGGYEAASAKMQ
ncbi:sphinganine C4-monooxygenase 2-like [Cryptomeria japonica]|uniref:sphinganine C4-monooxygenase 2-like n=1 Tax=Cryptomeria japonica TaxID=3369 RepID=UPI0027DA71B2|nr:sphinganine C4-monooxygenase 2-like [Cryptomeria japonica]